MRREVKQALGISRVRLPKTGATCFEILKWKRRCGPLHEYETSSRRTTFLSEPCVMRDLASDQRRDRQCTGSRFVERMLTVVATCRQQSRNVLDYLSSCFAATRRSHAIPSLLPAKPKKVKAA